MLQEHGNLLVGYSNEKESSKHSKQKETFEGFADKRMDEIQDFSQQVDFNKLMYNHKGNTAPKTFISFKG